MDFAAPRLLIAVLCAEWCGTCRDYAAVYAALRAALPQHDWRWIDVEDDEAVPIELDVETFPTLLVAHGAKVLFGGAVLPRQHDAQRLIEALMQDIASGRPVSPRVDAGQHAAYACLAARLTH